MSLKETIFSMMLEALELGEAVEVRHDRYMRSHGKKASGSGSFMFSHKSSGDVNVNNKEEVHTAQGKFADAKKSAQQWGKKHGHSAVYVLESVELDEAIQNMPDARLKFHAMKDMPHGSYSKKQINAEHDRRKKTMGAEYASVKPALSEEAEQIDEADAVVTHKWYSVKNWKDGSDHFDNLDDHLRGQSYKHPALGNTAKNRPDHHIGIPVKAKSAIAYMDKHAKAVNEEVEQIDEISDEKKKEYIRAVADKGGILRKPRPGSLKGFDRKKDDALVKAFKGGSMQDYANLHKKSEKRAGIALKALNSLKKEEVELDEAKTDMYHKHMLKALGKTRLPKDHNYTSAIANNGDFVVHNAGRVVGRIPKSEHDLK